MQRFLIKKMVFYVWLSFIIISCSDSKDKAECNLNDLEQQSLVSSCKACHTEYGLEDMPKVPSYKELYEMGEKRLSSKIDSLKKKDAQHIFFDTLSKSEISCIVNYIGRYKTVQP